MQIKKAGVVATGALATMAVMGAPAAAAPQLDAADLSKVSALSMARGAWSAPWEQPQQGAIVAGTGSVANGAAWQVCGGQAVWGVGGVVDLSSPNNVIGECNNGNIKIKQDTVPPVIGALNDTAIAAATWQVCGSTVMGGVGGTVNLQSPNTVFGPCKNGNIRITGPGDGKYLESAHVEELGLVKQDAKRQAAKKNDVMAARTAWATRTADTKAAPRHMDAWSAPWETEPQSAISVGSGSAVQGATWQVCGGEAVWGVGGVLTALAPSTVMGDCDNANVHITQDDPTAVISVLDNTSINLAPWQACGSTIMGGVGGTVNLQSPNTVVGSCNNANTVID